LQRGEFKIIPLSDVKDVTIEVREWKNMIGMRL
jgi:hypothetical protein